MESNDVSWVIRWSQGFLSVPRIIYDYYCFFIIIVALIRIWKRSSGAAGASVVLQGDAFRAPRRRKCNATLEQGASAVESTESASN